MPRITHTVDYNTLGPDGYPSRVTDYEFFFPKDFEGIDGPQLKEMYNSNYDLIGFSVQGDLQFDFQLLRIYRDTLSSLEYGILYVTDGSTHYRTGEVMEGEMAIGHTIPRGLAITDLIHTHSIFAGEEERKVNLLSPSDLLVASVKGIQRTWVVGSKEAYCLVNYHGNSNYHYVREASGRLAEDYDPQDTFDLSLDKLIYYVRYCEYRLFRSEDFSNFTKIS